MTDMDPIDGENDSAGPSTPRAPQSNTSMSLSTPTDVQTPAPNPPSNQGTSQSNTYSSSLVTPASQNDLTVDTPQAPAPNPAARLLPTETPAASRTPTANRPVPAQPAKSSSTSQSQNVSPGTGDEVAGGKDVDISQFDPYAPTTSTSKAGASPSSDTTPRKPSGRSKRPVQSSGPGPGPGSSLGSAGDTAAGAVGSSSGSRQSQPSSPSGESNTNANANANEPAFNFSGFLKDLRTKSAEPVARYLKSFLSNFAKKQFTVNEQIKLIHDFLNFISEKMEGCEPWRSQTNAEFDNATEAMEKLVMNRLYGYTFTPQLVASGPTMTDDLERDSVFVQRVRLFSWIREKHLDVPDGEASVGFLGFAEQELLKINHYKAPRDKMICILNCCKVIFGLIRHRYGNESTSADAFVPILIFVVIRANPENMWSNVEYINRFRRPEKLQGEAGYYLSSLTGAMTFIETMDASSLSNITQEEFEQNVENAIQDFVPSPTSEAVKRSAATTEISPFAPSTPGEEPARQLALPSVDNARRFFQRTGTQVQEAVSRPLNAIGKIFDGMQEDNNGVDPGTPTPNAGPSNSHLNNADSFTTPRRDRRGIRPDTPDSSWSNRFAAMGLSDSQPASGSATPSRDVPIPDFSSDELQSTLDMSQEVYEQTRQANIQTLRQMFPALDEDVVEAVLDACNDDLGAAIDRMLEM